MARHTFTRTDLARFAPLMKSPVVRGALNDTVQVKRLASEGRHVQRLPLALSARTRTNPSGVDLRYLLDAAKLVAPGVRSIAARGGTATVVSDRQPEPAEQTELAALLADPDRLRALNPTPPTDDELVSILVNPSTDDREWLQAFRRYAVTNLISGQQEPQ